MNLESFNKRPEISDIIDNIPDIDSLGDIYDKEERYPDEIFNDFKELTLKDELSEYDSDSFENIEKRSADNTFENFKKAFAAEENEAGNNIENGFEHNEPSNNERGELDKENKEGDKNPENSEKKGGSYGEVFKPGEGDKYEVHHMPANDVNELPDNDGPAIKMEKQDHRQTASCGNSKEAREYRSIQAELIKAGKFREAIQMDIDDIHEKFGDKYDDAISEMMEYVDKLEEEGRI